MIKIVGVRFRNAGKVYYFDPKDFNIKVGDHVIVETARGMEYGTVTGNLREIQDGKVVQPLKPVIRVATAADDERAVRNREREKEAMKICKEKIRKHELDMKLIDAEYTFDNNKVLFYFTADGRIDFRELVKDLASVFRTRIELRQIGVRDETKILGGIGTCGRPLCCSTFLSEFAPVSIKMAKEQNLSLNPTKISGVCGRLMCCLKNEEETYEYLNSNLPALGDTVYTITGLKGEVSSVNVLRQKVKVLVDVDDEKELQEYDVSDLKFRPRRKKEKGGTGDKELRQLEDLEQSEKDDTEKSDHREGRSRKEGASGKSGKAQNKQKRENTSEKSRRERIPAEDGERDKKENAPEKFGRARTLAEDGEGYTEENAPERSGREGISAEDGAHDKKRNPRGRMPRQEEENGMFQEDSDGQRPREHKSNRHRRRRDKQDIGITTVGE